MAIGLDTSVVLRLLVGVPAAQARAAQRRLERAIERGESVIVCDLVIAEAYYALQFHYDVPKADAPIKWMYTDIRNRFTVTSSAGTGHQHQDFRANLRS